MGHKTHTKKEKNIKTKEQRAIEVENIMQQFLDLGLPLESVQGFIKVAKEFEEYGYSATGKINLVGFQRVIAYKFSTQPHIVSSIKLEYNPHV